MPNFIARTMTMTSTSIVITVATTRRRTSTRWLHVLFFVALVLLSFAPSQLATQFGYTWSLFIFIIPSIFGLVYTRQVTESSWDTLLCPIARTCATLVPMGWILIYYLDNSFYRYPDPETVMGWTLENRSGGIETEDTPLEKYLFYLVACVFVATSYQFWLAAHGQWRKLATAKIPVRFNADQWLYLFPTALACFTVILMSVMELHIASDMKYLTYALPLVLCGAPWIALLVLRNRHRVHRSAFVFAFLAMALTACVWETFVALPRGYLAYVDRYTLPMYVCPGLPIEAVIVWFVVPIATILMLVDGNQVIRKAHTRVR